jgi:hypothetical protein
VSNQAFHGGARTIADTLAESLHALSETGTNVRAFPAETGQAQHHVKLPCEIAGHGLHGGAQRSRFDGSGKVAEK